MTYYLLVNSNDRSTSSLQYIRDIQYEAGIELVALDLNEDTIPKRDRSGKLMESRFKHTPEPLLASWRMSRQLLDRTKPGDVVVASDRSGLCGVFALLQASLKPHERRQVWTVAADSIFLDMQLVARTHTALPMPLDSTVDWEIAQYRASDRVLATSETALIELARLAIPAELVGSAEAAPNIAVGAISPNNAWAPGPVSRRNRTGDVLRAIESVPEAKITLSNIDRPDLIWEGSTWETLSLNRDVLGARVSRGMDPKGEPSVVIVGDPYSPPDEATRTYRRAGVPIVVPMGSVCSVLWPDAPQWSDDDDLTAVLKGLSPIDRSPIRTPPDRRVQASEIPQDHRISVGIPVFRDVRFLDECVESVLSQDLAPVEVIIVDDGSKSKEVDRALSTWVRRDGRIRLLEKPHRGVCVARNVALQEMTGNSFVFVDSDNMLAPTFLSSCARSLSRDATLWAVATWTEFFGDYEGIEAKPPFDARVGLRENPIISTAALVDMRVREAGIRFEPDLAFVFCEDWHFWSQIIAAGGRFGLVPEPLSRHRVHKSSGGHLRTELAYALGRSRAAEPLTHR